MAKKVTSSDAPTVVADLAPWVRNPRKINPRAARALAESMRRFGDLSGIVWNFRTRRLVSGHQRRDVLASTESGNIAWGDWREGPHGRECAGVLAMPDGARWPVRGVDWPERTERAANVAANNPHIGGDWTDEAADLLREIRTEDAALFEAVGLDALLRDLAGSDYREKSRLAEPDEEEPPDEPTTRRGTLWRLGGHRLLCGDGINDGDVATVLDGERPGVTIVDPPYEVDDRAYAKHITDPCIVFGPARVICLIPPELYRFERVILRPTHHRSAATQVGHRHALVIQAGSVKALPADKALTFDSVIEIGIGEQVVSETPFERLQRHGKPVELFIEHLTHWTPPWEVVFDPFCGTGTTIIAAERMGRRACGIELDPGRCDVIVSRWERETGQRATSDNGGA